MENTWFSEGWGIDDKENILINHKSKVSRNLWGKIVQAFREKPCYPMIYKSYWHWRYFGGTKSINQEQYYTSIPNFGAGIGHQIANWISGFWYAKQFGLNFAHSPFPSNDWDRFLSFGDHEYLVDDLVENKRFVKVLLPLFDERNSKEIDLIKRIISSYRGRKIVFISEQDQYYADQHGVILDIKDKFHNAVARKKDKLIYDPNKFNIAIHVRRGDIVVKKNNKNDNLLMRWQNNDYFIQVLSNVIKTIEIQIPIEIYLFSQGVEKDFSDFECFSNLHFCLNMNAQESFLHMVYADILITSKSSFSYKPALISNGIKVCPINFWHGYPNTSDFILVDDSGNFCDEKVTISFENIKN